MTQTRTRSAANGRAARTATPEQDRRADRAKRVGPDLPATRRRTRGFHVAAWIERHCVHTNGEWIGRPFRLLAWERELLAELFELKPDPERQGEWIRRYRWALIGLPKKNGKTELAAALALYLLIGDEEPAPLVPCAAASDDQADLVYGAARTMVEMSPTLSRVAVAYEREILVPSIPGAKLQRVAAVAGTNDGKNIHAAILDELHEWQGPRGEQVWNVLTNGSGNRRQPMIIQITTAGFDPDSILGKQYAHGERVAAGEIEDPSFYYRWHAAPPDADYRDPEVWRAANPSYGILVRPEYLADQLTKKSEATFRRYFLNQWTASEEAWLPAGEWDACAEPELELDPTRPAYVGIDVGLRHDSSAVTIAQRIPDAERRAALAAWDGKGDAPTAGKERTVVRARTWENPYGPRDPRHHTWRFNIAEVEQHLLELYRTYPEPAATVDGETMPGPEFLYDPNFFERSAELLRGEGLTMGEYPQTDPRMIPASQELYRLVLQRLLAHDGDPTLARHVANAIAHQKLRGWRLSKPTGSTKHIDAAISTAIASYAAQKEPPPPPKRRRVVSF